MVKLGLPGLKRVRSPLAPQLVSVDGTAVTTAARRPLHVDGALPLRGLTRDDVLVVPGLGMASAQEIERAFQSAVFQRATALVAKAANKVGMYAASCSATFLLAAAGVLDGTEATTTWWLGPLFAARFPRVTLRTERMVVRSGRALTAGSAFAQADLMLTLIALTSGPTLSSLLSQYLVVDQRPSQARYMISNHLRSDDPAVRRLERFVLENLERNLTVQELAEVSATSPRTLARKLDHTLHTTPLRFVQRLRMERAVHLLETSDASVDAVAHSVGYADAAAFRRVLRRETGRAPSEIRRGN